MYFYFWLAGVLTHPFKHEVPLNPTYEFSQLFAEVTPDPRNVWDLAEPGETTLLPPFAVLPPVFCSTLLHAGQS